jgi:hypothetical protein
MRTHGHKDFVILRSSTYSTFQHSMVKVPIKINSPLEKGKEAIRFSSRNRRKYGTCHKAHVRPEII